jgi:hypothetical protein
MAKFQRDVARTCDYVKVAASATTAPVSKSGDGIVGKDYLERLIVVAATTAATPGAVTLFDGDVTLLTHLVGANANGTVYTYELNILAQTTEGFNITTGTSVFALAVGLFSGV